MPIKPQAETKRAVNDAPDRQDLGSLAGPLFSLFKAYFFLRVNALRRVSQVDHARAGHRPPGASVEFYQCGSVEREFCLAEIKPRLGVCKRPAGMWPGVAEWESKMFRLPLLSAASIALAISAPPLLAANTASDAATSYVMGALAELEGAPQIWRAIRAGNVAHATLDEETIIGMDNDWRAEIGHSARPTIDPVISSTASGVLRDMVDQSDGQLTEIIVMDAVGLNAAISALTSDYWQGDEAKFSATFGKAPGTLHVSEIEFDESTQTYQMQVSLPLFDPVSGAAVGAATFGLNAEAF
ncbi:hypothetical protein [Roseivivax sp. CAU 1753]